MAELSYGWREGPGKGKEYPVAANQYFHRRGGAFVYLDTNGRATICKSSDCKGRKIYGYLEKSKDASGRDSWKSSSTAGADLSFVITGVENRFELPGYEANASVAITQIGEYAKIATYTATKASYNARQRVEVNTVAASAELVIYDVDTTNKTYIVGINPRAEMNQK